MFLLLFSSHNWQPEYHRGSSGGEISRAYLFYSEALFRLKFMPDFTPSLFCKDDNKLLNFTYGGPGSSQWDIETGKTS